MRRLLALVAITAFAAQLQPLDQTGYAKMLQAHRGHAVLVDFWATWCDSCRDEMPHLVELAQRMKIQLITVSADEPEKESDANTFLDRQHVTGPRYIKRAVNDQQFIDSIDPKWSGALPAIFVYDAAGTKVASLIGEPTLAEIESAMHKAIRR